ncbi:RNase H domain-containing protein [Trichonephila clavipes]|nr:RNase H domain-containing protein [Trichonephila clavipes]
MLTFGAAQISQNSSLLTISLSEKQIHKRWDGTNVETIPIHLQWIPSHVNIAGNGIADSLAKAGAAQHTMNSAALTYLELHSTCINNKQSTVPPDHHWYEAKRPGDSLFRQCSRKEQTILTRFRSRSSAIDF